MVSGPGAKAERSLTVQLENFPSDFKWGAATASFQIEGATGKDGRGPSVWDTFCSVPGNVANFDNGEIACDHYHRIDQDVALMKQLGLQSYRFSIAWPRLFPAGDSVREERGFAFYNKLIDALLAADIEPVATIYHWDLPQALQDDGGWANRKIVDAFAQYAVATVEAFGDRVKSFITLNEPWVFGYLGYGAGIHAPGVKDSQQALAVAHHTALAHGVATRAIRAVRNDVRVGISLNMTNFRVTQPGNDQLNQLQQLMDSHQNRWWLDAITAGTYPANLVEYLGQDLAKLIQPGDMDLVKVPTDFLGINYYCDNFISPAAPDAKPMSDFGVFPFHFTSDGSSAGPHTDMGWPITPDGFYDLLVRIKNDWPQITDIQISENGAAYDDAPDASGKVADVRRTEYLLSHLDAMGRAIAAGAPVTHYFAWSLLDNFEWAEGYAKRFGLIYVDFNTQQRFVKDSAHAYAAIISNHVQSLASAAS